MVDQIRNTYSQIYIQIVFTVKGRDSLIFLILSLVILSFLISPSVSSQGTWERIDVPTDQDLRSVCFIDSLYGWAAGDSGMIIHTADGGESWEIQDSQTEYDVMSLFFLDRNQGWASSINYATLPYGTIILKTTTGGDDWTSTPYPEENIFITCMLFFDSLTGWMGGQPHALVKTTNGGTDWTQASIDTSILAFFPVLGIQFFNEQIGYACGGIFDIAGVTWRTTNGGEMWYALEPSQAPADEVHGLHIFDATHVMGAGGDPDYGYGVGILRTADGGLNWDYDELGIQGNAYDLDFRNASEVWAPLGQRLKFIYSLDTGNTWTSIPTPDSTAIFDVTFPDSMHGFAVGSEGAFLRYNPPVHPAIPPLQHKSEHVSCQLYPNPTKGNSKFEIRNLEPGFISIQIYSLLGTEVASLVNKNLPAGKHQVDFIGGSLPAGVYLYQLRFNDSVVLSKRMLVFP
ncbi:MAG: T9SS type A sorting domain-containing protein [Bacteroidales bacterium]|nr:T9SS type A sorting domain-containing protein [Bacteroidales bacterium]